MIADGKHLEVAGFARGQLDGEPDAYTKIQLVRLAALLQNEVDRDCAKVVLGELCIGCHLCTIACPFGTVFTLPQSDHAAKCNLCGGQPACAAACPTQAIVYGESGAPGQWLASWGAKVHRNHVEAFGRLPALSSPIRLGVSTAPIGPG